MSLLAWFRHAKPTPQYHNSHSGLVSTVSMQPNLSCEGRLPGIKEKSCANVSQKRFVGREINSQSLEDTQVGYILQKYSLDKCTSERAFKPSCTFSSI